MDKRVTSSIIGVPLLFFFLIMGGTIMKIGMIGISLIGMHELYIAISKEDKTIHKFGYAAAVIYILILCGGFKECDIIFAWLFILAMSCMVIMHKKINVTDVVFTVFGVLYIPVMFGFIYLIREEISYGEYLVYLPFLCAFGCDTGAYFTGLKFGKKKLIPDLSPKKTVEGAVGGTITAMAITAVFGFIVGKWLIEGNIIYYTISFAAIGLIGAIFSQFGDLTASAIKRYAGVKDYGKIMPGHGGILDRFDSVIFTSGVVYIIARILF